MGNSSHPGALSIFVIGLRAFPDVPGGVETHAQHLYPRIVRMGHQVTVATRSPYHQVDEWNGVRFLRIWAPKSKFLEAIMHTTLAVFRAALLRPDLVHFHAVGPSLLVPLARLAGLKVVVTHHGPDYDREKWNRVARSILRSGEWCGMRLSNERIVISTVIQDMVMHKHRKSSVLIPNGVQIPALDYDQRHLSRHGLEPGKYVLMVSRFVPEKRHFDLIEAFELAAVPGFKLALVGDADHPDAYERELKARAAANAAIVLTGFISGDELKAVFSSAAVFVLPSSHEGLPISLLEALSFGLSCIASGIPANRSVGLDERRYFPLGDTTALAEKLREFLRNSPAPMEREAIRNWIRQIYDWDDIAARTIAVYASIAR